MALLSATAWFQTKNVHSSFLTTDYLTSKKIRVARVVSIPPMTQAEVQVSANVGGLSFLQFNPRTVRKRLVLMANGVIELIPKRSFQILVYNFVHAPIHLAKNIIVGLAMPAQISLMSRTPKKLGRGETLPHNPIGHRSPTQPSPTIVRIKSV